MLSINTEFKTINAPQATVFSFLSDINNLQNLMPDRVEGWSSDTESCSFTIKGMATIEMKVRERQPDSKIIMESFGKSPFPFTLEANIRNLGDQTEVALSFNGEMNAFMKMMAEGPLSNFFNMLVEKLPTQFA
jgi:carbon monoxide dehydrogenase subunit G